METFESFAIEKEGWQVVKELHRLSDKELRERLRNCSPAELDAIDAACDKADPGDSSGSDGSTHIARANARRAGMGLAEFQEEVGRIIHAVADARQNG